MKRSEIWDSLVLANIYVLACLWPCNAQSHFGVIWCIYDFQTKKKKHYLFYKSQPKFVKLLLDYFHKIKFGIFEILKIGIFKRKFSK